MEETTQVTAVDTQSNVVSMPMQMTPVEQIPTPPAQVTEDPGIANPLIWLTPPSEFAKMMAAGKKVPTAPVQVPKRSPVLSFKKNGTTEEKLRQAVEGNFQGAQLNAVLAITDMTEEAFTKFREDYLKSKASGVPVPATVVASDSNLADVDLD